ncbi:MAG: hypothetical protein FJ290_30040 [Planctomycetes bacterium]|nr:hypothetical protein [Planctomycetota bacterium]
MSKSDETIEEVRRARRRMSEECGHDPKRFVELLQDYNRRYAAQVRNYRRSHRPTAASASRNP